MNKFAQFINVSTVNRINFIQHNSFNKHKKSFIECTQQSQTKLV